MVLFFTSCPTSSLVSQSPTPSSTTSTTTTSDVFVEHPKSQPIPVRNNGQWDNSDHLSCSPLERFPSPLATSAESVNSIKSSCSSRSSAERETERAQCRQLLNSSLSKLREESNMPLRKHLLIFNTVKTIQKDLDQLDDEELYCSLVGMSNETTMLMEVDGTGDECCWGNEKDCYNNEMMMLISNANDVVDSAVICGAPLKQEERGASSDITGMMFGDDLEMDEADTKTWSWSSGASIFDSVQESKSGSMDALFKWSSSCSDAAYSAPITSNSFGGWADSSAISGGGLFGLPDDSTSSWSHGATGFDMWGNSDPLGSARFDMHNLLLLQA
ncbi:Protein CBG18891 [Caenorhabditis briggsae]|uniref:SERTA domain-containing protein n=3 Tax=Caenorhabditis briggsae TaxID=6238 RepID=A0AAE9A4X8_CAEBR|nr:Protein CBG18891 [Caenorhabditis briggsae]ULT90188.1 hypothetical protein L3Y34_008506 [Caenorhabditis briggsae]UMM35995.1 hypothetical protein L5515_008351 [Caenorhabditis briggsae]CAP36233.1 Protein CBG18891 [Caenorhabditis briggsae]